MEVCKCRYVEVWRRRGMEVERFGGVEGALVVWRKLQTLTHT